MTQIGRKFSRSFSNFIHRERPLERNFSETDQKITIYSSKIKYPVSNEYLQRSIKTKPLKSASERTFRRFSEPGISPAKNGKKALKILLKNILDTEPVEGIFRMSGKAKKVDAAYNAIKKGKEVNEDFFSDLSIHEKTGVIKKLLDPYNGVLETIKIENFNSKEIENLESGESDEKIKLQIQNLKEPHKQSFKFLLQALDQLSQRKEITKMGASNLGTIFGTKLISKTEKTTPIDSIDQMSRASRLATYMIEHADRFTKKKRTS